MKVGYLAAQKLAAGNGSVSVPYSPTNRKEAKINGSEIVTRMQGSKHRLEPVDKTYEDKGNQKVSANADSATTMTIFNYGIKEPSNLEQQTSFVHDTLHQTIGGSGWDSDAAGHQGFFDSAASKVLSY
jgi:hypothetical protein